MSDSQIDVPHPLKYTFGYATGFIFLLGIMIYLYLLITDHLEDPNQHTVEETIWIYMFLCILIIGFILSYYTITCGIKQIKDNEIYKAKATENSWGFGGIKKIPSRPSLGQYKIIHTSKFTV